MRRVLASVYDKRGLRTMSRGLRDLGDVEFIASGGTGKALKQYGAKPTTIEKLTGQPDRLGGLIKTLYPEVIAGLLADTDKPSHWDDLMALNAEPIWLVLNNLYPFGTEPSIGNIDIGGVTMIRAAAKNHARVSVVVDPADYGWVLAELRANGQLSPEIRRKLAAKVFAHTGLFDLAIARWLSDGDYDGVIGQKVHDCDYGENKYLVPAALYKDMESKDPLGLPAFEVVAGRSPSYINYTDLDRELRTLVLTVAMHLANCDHKKLWAVVADKHGNPCGAGTGSSPRVALERALVGDLQAVNGAVIIMNFPITVALTDTLYHFKTERRRLLDGICAPAVDPEALERLGRRDGKFFVAVNPALSRLNPKSLDGSRHIRSVRGGFLTQPGSTKVIDLKTVEVMSGGLTSATTCDEATAIAVCATSNSNTTSLVADGRLIGNGVAQQDRVGSARLAVSRAVEAGHEDELAGSVAATDSFYMGTDGPSELTQVGVGTVYATRRDAPSLVDDEVVAHCEGEGATLLMLPDSEGRLFSNH